MTPYFGNIGWWRDHLQSLITGKNADNENLSPRELIRCRIPGNRGEGQLLSIPICGGSSTVKRIPAHKWEISQHGRWQSIHIGAIEAAYGKAPYFSHFADRLFPIIKNATGNAMVFNESVYRAIIAGIGLVELLPTLINVYSRESRTWETLIQRGEELSEHFSDDDCILDIAMRLGHEAILPLTCTFMHLK